MPDDGDASRSPRRSDRIVAAMPATHDDSTQRSHPETPRRHEIGDSSSTKEAAINEAVAPMASRPVTDSMLLHYSSIGRETSMRHEIAGSSSTAEVASDEAAAPTSGLVRGCASGLQFGTVPIEMLSDISVKKKMLSDINTPTNIILDIWNDKVSQAFDEITSELQRGHNRLRLVGLDTEFCRLDGIVQARGPPTSAEDHYQQTRINVDWGNLVQVGIAIANTEGSCRAVYQFNLQFDRACRDSDSPSIAFLRNVAKLDLDAHSTRGINPSTFFQHLALSGLLNNTDIIWVTYQGYSDFGFLLRGLHNTEVLPVNRRDFLLLVYKYFPRSFDLKVFHSRGICCDPPIPGIRGSASFQSMADALRVNRMGEAHGAGSDAHLTLLCYHAMLFSNPLAAFLLFEYRNTVYGVEEALPRLPQDSELCHIEVLASNWDSQSKLIIDMFQSNISAVVGLETSVGYEFRSRTPIPYHTGRVHMEGLPGPVKFSLAVSDHFGRICFGRIWTLNIQGTSKDPSHVRHDQLATMLTEANALFNHDITWCSSSSFAHICLLKALTTARCLPVNLQGLYQVHAAFCPSSRVVPLRLTEISEGHRSLTTLRFFMKNPAMTWLPFSGFY